MRFTDTKRDAVIALAEMIKRERKLLKAYERKEIEFSSQPCPTLRDEVKATHKAYRNAKRVSADWWKRLLNI